MPIDRVMLDRELGMLADELRDTPEELAALSVAIYLEDVASVRLTDEQIGPQLLEPGASAGLLGGSAGVR